jgi:hypothetical protein
MKKQTLLKRATATALLSATLAAPAVIGLTAGTASALPIEDTVGGAVCSQSGGAWQEVWGAGTYIGGTCTYGNFTRYHYDSNDVMYLEERKVRGKWVRYNG